MRQVLLQDQQLEGAPHQTLAGAGEAVVDYQVLGLAGGFLDSIVDAGQLRADLNSLTWELCKPQYAPDEVRDYEEGLLSPGTPPQHRRNTVAEQSPGFYRSFRQPAHAVSSEVVSSGARQLDQLVQSEYERAVESRKSGENPAKVPVRNVLEPEPDGLLRYIRACYHKVPAGELPRMSKELTSLLGMFQATGKLESTDWDAFPAPF